jgi:hypothetical protein
MVGIGTGEREGRRREAETKPSMSGSTEPIGQLGVIGRGREGALRRPRIQNRGGRGGEVKNDDEMEEGKGGEVRGRIVKKFGDEKKSSARRRPFAPYQLSTSRHFTRCQLSLSNSLKKSDGTIIGAFVYYI